jgi:hypothetical protein
VILKVKDNKAVVVDVTVRHTIVVSLIAKVGLAALVNIAGELIF